MAFGSPPGPRTPALPGRPGLPASWAAVALLVVDVFAHGVVMSAESQPVEILGGENRVLATGARQTRNPIVARVGGGFVGLVGFAGTEQIEGVTTREWLRRFIAERPDDNIGTFCTQLAERLTDTWQRDGLRSVLEILVTGEVGGDLQFWFVRNSQGLRDSDWRHEPPADVFVTQNDLDDAHIPAARRHPGEPKDRILKRMNFSFRQGVLLPGATVFDAFGALMRVLYVGDYEGFVQFDSRDDLGQFARVRLELLKRLCSPKYGIAEPDRGKQVLEKRRAAQGRTMRRTLSWSESPSCAAANAA